MASEHVLLDNSESRGHVQRQASDPIVSQFNAWETCPECLKCLKSLIETAFNVNQEQFVSANDVENVNRL